MAKDLNQLAREWIGRKIAGESSQTTLSQMKRQYYMEQLGASAGKAEHILNLEKYWLKKWITDNGGTPNSNYNSDLWRQAIVVLGKPVSNKETANQVTFYLNAA